MVGVTPPWAYLKASQAKSRLQVFPHELSCEIRRAERPFSTVTTAAFAGRLGVFARLRKQNN